MLKSHKNAIVVLNFFLKDNDKISFLLKVLCCFWHNWPWNPSLSHCLSFTKYSGIHSNSTELVLLIIMSFREKTVCVCKGSSVSQICFHFWCSSRVCTRSSFVNIVHFPSNWSDGHSVSHEIFTDDTQLHNSSPPEDHITISWAHFKQARCMIHTTHTMKMNQGIAEQNMSPFWSLQVTDAYSHVKSLQNININT